MQRFEPPSPATAPGNVMDWDHVPRRRRDVVAIPTVWLTLILSLLTHFAMLWYFLPQIPHPTGNGPDAGKAGSTLVAQLQPMPPPAASPPARTSPGSRRRHPFAPHPARRRREGPRRHASLPRIPAQAAADHARAAAGRHRSCHRRPRKRTSRPMSQRAARSGESHDAPGRAPAEVGVRNRNERRDRDDRRQSRVGPAAADVWLRSRGPAEASSSSSACPTRFAEFWFTGWDKDIGRRAKQLIDVRRGTNSDIRLAIVRRIISIIRDEVKEDFSWKSERSGRVDEPFGASRRQRPARSPSCCTSSFRNTAGRAEAPGRDARRAARESPRIAVVAAQCRPGVRRSAAVMSAPRPAGALDDLGQARAAVSSLLSAKVADRGPPGVRAGPLTHPKNGAMGG